MEQNSMKSGNNKKHHMTPSRPQPKISDLAALCASEPHDVLNGELRNDIRTVEIPTLSFS
jgi:hypothetical protein